MEKLQELSIFLGTQIEKLNLVKSDLQKSTSREWHYCETCDKYIHDCEVKTLANRFSEDEVCPFCLTNLED